MVTCKQLLGLDSFASITLVAGKNGLDRAVSWPYPKHTKSVAPWVHGGEFLMISGFEFGVNEEELLQIIDEAAANRLSGVLVEGGINFKELSVRVKKAADAAAVPLFFAFGTVNFVDITREIGSLILENQMLAKREKSLLDQLLNPQNLSAQDRLRLLEFAGLSEDTRFSIALFSIVKSGPAPSKSGKGIGLPQHLAKDLQGLVGSTLENFGLKRFYSMGMDSIAYLLYCRSPQESVPVEAALHAVCARLGALHPDIPIYLSFSSPALSAAQIPEGYNQAYFTAMLQQHRLLAEGARSFPETGSYRLIFQIDRKETLLEFRDDYLKALHLVDEKSSSQLLETLRTYLAHNGNMLRTAEVLIIHRNTLQYRMDRIKAILRRDLSSPAVKRDLLNAFMILELYPFPE